MVVSSESVYDEPPVGSDEIFHSQTRPVIVPRVHRDPDEVRAPSAPPREPEEVALSPGDRPTRPVAILPPPEARRERPHHDEARTVIAAPEDARRGWGAAAVGVAVGVLVGLAASAFIRPTPPPPRTPLTIVTAAPSLGSTVESAPALAGTTDTAPPQVAPSPPAPRPEVVTARPSPRAPAHRPVAWRPAPRPAPRPATAGAGTIIATTPF